MTQKTFFRPPSAKPDAKLHKNLKMKKGKLFSSPNGILYVGDCLDLFSSIQSESIDVVFADPPFNLNKNYGPKAPDQMDETSYLEWSEAWLNEAVRVLKPGGALYVYNIPKWAIHIGSFLNDKMQFNHWIAICMKNTYPRGKNLYPAHYALLYYTKGEPKTFNKLRTPIPTCRHCEGDIKDYGGHRNKLHPDGLNLTDFWDDTSPVRHSKFKKRTENELKPMIPKRAIEISSDEGDIILDPFGGGGGTFAMAEETKRFWVGSEIETYGAILERLQEEYFVDFSKSPDTKLLQIFEEIK